MNNEKSMLGVWFEHGLISKEAQQAALTQIHQDKTRFPTSLQWRSLFDLMLIWLAGLLIGSGIIFFVAANWQDMSQFVRFALVETCLLLTLSVYLVIRKRALNRGDLLGFGYTTANALLLLICLIIGSLFALVGQTYQTGADPWQLFAVWGLFVLPLALVAGTELLWLLFGLLVNAALLLYFDAFPGAGGLVWGANSALAWLFVLNLALHLSCLFLSGEITNSPVAQFTHKQRFFAPLLRQLTILAALSIVTILSIEAIFDWKNSIWLMIYFALITAGYFLYNRYLQDIFVLAIGSFSLVAVANSLLIRATLEGDEPVGMFLVLGVSIIGSTTAVTLWLKQRHKAFSQGGLSDIS